MKVNRISVGNPPGCRNLLALVFILAFISIVPGSVVGQSVDSDKTAAAAAVQARIERARALAAVHQLAAAASELESLRATAADDVVRNVTSVMLMNIYLEEGSYTRAESLLEETFRSRAAEKDRSIRTYFVLAGQAVNGARSHLARYRTFGINVSDPGLPAEALSDLERLRSLLERMIAQAMEISRDDSKAYDSRALLEDVLGIRLSLSRDGEDRQRWESEYASARQSLASSQRQIASLAGLPPIQSTARPTPAGGDVSSSASSAKAENLPTAPEPSSGSVASADSNSQSGAFAAESEKSSEPTIVSAGLLNPRATKKVTPFYPQAAKSAGVEGVVRVHVSVNESGKVSGVFNSDGPPELRNAATTAARQWRFPPTLIEGKPVRLTGHIEIIFTLASP